jgi:competence protein ComEA
MRTVVRLRMADPEREPRARPAAALDSLRARAAGALRFHRRETVALGALATLLVAGALIAYVRARPVAAAPLAPVVSVSASPDAAARIWVDVAGAVRRPGVYRFDEGTRVFEAIRAAGGFARDADRHAINLARAVADGEQIVVPRKGESAAGAGSPANGGAGSGGGGRGGGPGARGGAVNINAAAESDFEGLPGIGPVLAQRIVDYRAQHGPFHVVEDLMKVPGIGPKKFESLKPYVTV